MPSVKREPISQFSRRSHVLIEIKLDHIIIVISKKWNVLGKGAGHLKGVSKKFAQVDVLVLDNTGCESALQKTRLGQDFLLHPVQHHYDYYD